MLKVAVAQMRSGIEPAANLDVIADFAEQASGAGADYLLTPEVSVAFGKNAEQFASVTEPFEGNSAVERCSGIARVTGLILHVGSLAVGAEGGKYHNRSVVFGPDGAIKAVYDKIHLFDADLPGDRAYRESATYHGGDQTVLTDVGGMKLGLSICYDVRFAGLYADLALQGAQMISVPAAFTVPTGEAHWEVLLRSRAIETGCYVLAAAQGGLHENGRRTYGHSMIVDPWGQIVAQKDDDEPGLIFTEIDPAKVEEARARVPALANRRRYSLSVNQAARQ